MAQTAGAPLAGPVATGYGASRANGDAKGKGRKIETEVDEQVVAGPSRPYGAPREDETPAAKAPRVEHGPVRYA